MLVTRGDLHHRDKQIHSLSCSSSTLPLSGVEGNVYNLWWTYHLFMMRREAALWNLGLAEQNKGHKESWGKHPWEGTKGVWQLREEKQLRSKQKRYQAQRLGELKKGNGNEAPGSGVRACWILTEVNLCRPSPGSQDIQSVGWWEITNKIFWSLHGCLCSCKAFCAGMWTVLISAPDCLTNSSLQFFYLPVSWFWLG